MNQQSKLTLKPLLKLLAVFKADFLAELKRAFGRKEIRTTLIAGTILYSVLYSSVYYDQRIKESAVGVVDQDHSALSRSLIRSLDATEELKIRDQYLDLSSAEEALAKQEIDSILYLPRDLSKAFYQGKGAVAAMGVSSSNIVVASPMLSGASNVASAVSADVYIRKMTSRNLHRSRAQTLARPLGVDIRPIYNPNMNYSTFMIPGLIFVIIQQILIVSIGLSVTEEKELGIFASTKESAFMTAVHVKARCLPYALIGLIFSLLLTYGLLPFFQIEMELWKIPAFLLLTLLFTTACSYAGFALSMLFKDRVTALVALSFYSLPGFLMSGYSWPNFRMPLDIRALGLLFPATSFVTEIRKLILGPIAWESYLQSALQLLLFSAIAMVLILLALRPKRGGAQA